MQCKATRFLTSQSWSPFQSVCQQLGCTVQHGIHARVGQVIFSNAARRCNGTRTAASSDSTASWCLATTAQCCIQCSRAASMAVVPVYRVTVCSAPAVGAVWGTGTRMHGTTLKQLLTDPY